MFIIFVMIRKVNNPVYKIRLLLYIYLISYKIISLLLVINAKDQTSFLFWSSR